MTISKKMSAAPYQSDTLESDRLSCIEHRI